MSAGSRLEEGFKNQCGSSKAGDEIGGASCPISRARRYATSVIPGTGRTIGSRTFCSTRIVASCSCSDSFSEAKRNPESRRSAIAISSSNRESCRSRRVRYRRRARQCFPVRLSSGQPLKEATGRRARVELRLEMGILLRCFPDLFQ